MTLILTIILELSHITAKAARAFSAYVKNMNAV